METSKENLKRYYTKIGEVQLTNKDKINYDISDPNSEHLLFYCDWENSQYKNSYKNALSKDSDYYLPLQGKYNLDDLKESIKLLTKDNDSEYSTNLDSMDRNYQYMKTNNLTVDDKKACTLALSYITTNKENFERINGNINVLIRGENDFTKKEKWNDGKIVYPIIHYLSKALANLPSYSGYTIKCVDIVDENIISDYEPGKIITWLQFSSALIGKNCSPFLEKRNTRFYIYSLTSRDISHFVPYSPEREVLYSPFSHFLVLKKEYKNGKNLIFMRQIEIGLYINNIIWINKDILNHNYEYREIIEKAYSSRLDFKIIPKTSLDLAFSFLSGFRDNILNPDINYKVIIDITKNKEWKLNNKVENFVINLLNNHFCFNEIMIVTSSPYEMKEDFKNLEYELPETVKITDSPNDVFQFLVTYNARIFDF